MTCAVRRTHHFVHTALMVQVFRTMEKVREAGVDVMTFGQYMRPSRKHMPVSEYVTPEAFEDWRKLGEEMVRTCSIQDFSKPNGYELGASSSLWATRM